MPSSDLPKLSIWNGIPYFDKLVHIGLHTMLSFIWLQAIYEQKPFVLKNIVVWLLAFCLLYGIIIEVTQYILEDGRNAESWDVLANFTGSLIGVFLFLLFRKFLKT